MPNLNTQYDTLLNSYKLAIEAEVKKTGLSRENLSLSIGMSRSYIDMTLRIGKIEAAKKCLELLTSK